MPQRTVPESPTFDSLNSAVADSLKPVSAGLALLYIVLAVNYGFLLSGPVRLLMVVVAVVTALIFLSLRLALERWQFPVKMAHPVGAAIAGLVLLNILLHLTLFSDSGRLTYLLLLIVGVGAFMLSIRWLGATIIVIIVAWGITVGIGGGRVDPLSAGFGFLAAIILALAIHITRVRTLTRLETLRQQDRLQKEALQTLYHSEMIRRRLAEILYGLAEALNQTLRPGDVLDVLLVDLKRIIPYDQASVILSKNSHFEMAASRGFPYSIRPDQLQTAARNEADIVYPQLAETRRPLVITDVLDWPNWQWKVILPQVRSWLGIPLIHQDQLIGVLSLMREQRDAFDQTEVNLAAAFAGQAAIAVENTRMYDKLLHFIDDLEQEVEDRTSDLQVAYIQLDRLNQTKSDFIIVASHELRTPLTVLRGYSDMLLQTQSIQDNPAQQNMVEGIQSGAIRLTEVVNHLTDIAKVESDSLDLFPESLSLAELVDLACEEFWPSLAERNLSLHIEQLETLPDIEADPDALLKVFSNLISNAIKYTPDGGSITITGRYHANGLPDIDQPAVELAVCDTGIGIDRQFHRLIFTKFYQLEDLELHSTSRTNFMGGGPGLGLTIVRGIIEAHGGKVWVESKGRNEETLPGSEFHLVLPLTQPAS